MKSLTLSQPHVILMVGVPGSGKTFFAEKFSETFNAPYVDSNTITPLAADDDAAAMLTQQQITQLFKTHQSIIVEGYTDTRTERDKLSKQARTAGYEVLQVWVQTDAATAKYRAIKDSKNKTNRTMSSDEYDKIAKRFTPPRVPEKFIVISGKHTYATQARIVLKKLSAPRAAISTHDTPPARQQPNRRNTIIVR